jgi:hypothetical protein
MVSFSGATRVPMPELPRLSDRERAILRYLVDDGALVGERGEPMLGHTARDIAQEALGVYRGGGRAATGALESMVRRGLIHALVRWPNAKAYVATSRGLEALDA